MSYRDDIEGLMREFVAIATEPEPDESRAAGVDLALAIAPLQGLLLIEERLAETNAVLSTLAETLLAGQEAEDEEDDPDA